VVSIDDGSMNSQDREKSLEAIKKDDRVKVILISFKAGSTGVYPLCQLFIQT